METRDIPVLETERLRLRAFRLSDFEGYATMCGDPEVARYLMTRFDREQAWRHLAFLIGHWVLRGFGMWVVEEKATGAFVGRIGFAEPEGWPGCELRLDPGAALLGARIRHRRRPRRSVLRLQRLEKRPRRQPHPPGEPGLHPAGRAPRREIAGTGGDFGTGAPHLRRGAGFSVEAVALGGRGR